MRTKFLLVAVALTAAACGVGEFSSLDADELDELWSLGDELTLRQCSARLFDGGLPPRPTPSPDGGRRTSTVDRATVCALRDCLLEGTDGGLVRRDGTPVLPCSSPGTRPPGGATTPRDGGR